MSAVLLVSHGSRSPQTEAEVAVLAEAIRVRLPGAEVRYAFLELQTPSIPEALDQLAQKGAGEVVVVLNFLNAGRHVDVDIPRLVREAAERHPGVGFRMTPPIGQHPGLPDLFVNLISSASAPPL